MPEGSAVIQTICLPALLLGLRARDGPAQAPQSWVPGTRVAWACVCAHGRSGCPARVCGQVASVGVSGRAWGVRQSVPSRHGRSQCLPVGGWGYRVGVVPNSHPALTLCSGPGGPTLGDGCRAASPRAASWWGWVSGKDFCPPSASGRETLGASAPLRAPPCRGPAAPLPPPLSRAHAPPPQVLSVPKHASHLPASAAASPSARTSSGSRRESPTRLLSGLEVPQPPPCLLPYTQGQAGSGQSGRAHQAGGERARSAAGATPALEPQGAHVKGWGSSWPFSGLGDARKPDDRQKRKKEREKNLDDW